MNPPPPNAPVPPPDPNAELAETAAKGCLVGLGAAGIGIVVVIGVLAALILVGAFLIFLTCSGM